MTIKIVDAGRRKAPTSGYGLMSEQFGERLKAYGHDIHYFDQDPTKKADMWLWIRPPHYAKEKYFDETNFNVFFTMHEKETFEGWKKDWPETLNKCNAIITPTEWNKGVFSREGVTVPIYVCPLGVNTKIFKGYKNRRFAMMSAYDGLGSNGSRENWKENIETYYETFYDNYNADVVYTQKSWRVDHYAWVGWRDKLIGEKGYDRAKLPEVQVMEIDLVPQDFNLLYAKHHVFVKNSRGEGWSLPTLEALSCGLRIISQHTPAMVFLNDINTDFFNNKNELKDKMWENYRRWRKIRVAVDQWSWRESAKKLAIIIDNVKT